MSATKETYVKVKDVMHRLQPGMRYQRVLEAEGSWRKEQYEVTGLVISSKDDVDGAPWITVVEFYVDKYGAVNFPNANRPVLGPESDLAVLEYNEEAIEAAVDAAFKSEQKATEKAHESWKHHSDQLAKIADVYDVIVKDRLVRDLPAAEIVSESPDYVSRVMDAVNDAAADLEGGL